MCSIFCIPNSSYIKVHKTKILSRNGPRIPFSTLPKVYWEQDRKRRKRALLQWSPSLASTSLLRPFSHSLQKFLCETCGSGNCSFWAFFWSPISQLEFSMWKNWPCYWTNLHWDQAYMCTLNLFRIFVIGPRKIVKCNLDKNGP